MSENDIPEEIRKMFPNMPIHKMDIDKNRELHILASAEPLEPDPHFEDIPIEQVNQYLREHGYDPEQVGVRGKILTDVLIENIKLKEHLEAAEKRVAMKLEERVKYLEAELDRMTVQRDQYRDRG